MKRIYLHAFCILLVLSPVVLFPQVQQDWVRHYISSGISNASDMTTDASGNVIITGRSGVSTFNYNITTIKYNPAGVQQWSVVYAGPTNEFDDGLCVATDASGNIYVAGVTSVNEEQNLIVIKYSSLGIQQWVTVFDGAGNQTDDVPMEMAIDGAGNIYVTGYSWESFSNNASPSVALTIKYNPSGSIQWVKTYYLPTVLLDLARGVSIKLDAVGNAYVAIESNYDIVTIKYNAAGSAIWQKRYHHIPGNSRPENLVLDANGNVYVGGASNSSSGLKMVVIKYNNNGAQQWVKHLNSNKSTYDRCQSIAVDPSGNIVVAGTRIVNSPPNNDIVVVKLNSSGTVLWQASHSESSDSYEETIAMTLDNAGNVFVVGTLNASSPDFLTVKFSASGIKAWNIIYSNNYEVPVDIATVTTNQPFQAPKTVVYVTGRGGTDHHNSNMTTVKYSQPQVNGRQAIYIDKKIPTSPTLSNHPNPFKESTRIFYEIPSDSYVLISVYDAAGKQVATLVNRYQKAGSYEVPFHRRSHSKGVYHYSIRAYGGDKTYLATNQMLLD